MENEKQNVFGTSLCVFSILLYILFSTWLHVNLHPSKDYKVLYVETEAVEGPLCVPRVLGNVVARVLK